MASGEFLVVGHSLVHGLTDAVPILGPLPSGWEVILLPDETGKLVQHYKSGKGGSYTDEDPRLGRIPPNWERVAKHRNPDDPEIFDRFRNMDTGELINSDPRLFPDALRARGVNLESFRLI